MNTKFLWSSSYRRDPKRPHKILKFSETNSKTRNVVFLSNCHIKQSKTKKMFLLLIPYLVSSVSQLAGSEDVDSKREASNLVQGPEMATRPDTSISYVRSYETLPVNSDKTDEDVLQILSLFNAIPPKAPRPKVE